MAYKKYIKRGGKLYGPYIYHSKRVDGKVVSEYHGPKKEKNYQRFLLIGLAVIFLFVIVYLIASGHGRSTTGNAILDLNANYQQGQPLSGKLSLSLQQGELLPSTSKLVFDNNGNVYEYSLQDLISESTQEGNFYISGSSLSGSGSGYGIPGQKQTFPEIQFTLNILSESQNSSEQTSSDTIGSNSSGSSSQEMNSETSPNDSSSVASEQVNDSQTQSSSNNETSSSNPSDTNTNNSIAQTEQSTETVPEVSSSTDASVEDTIVSETNAVEGSTDISNTRAETPSPTDIEVTSQESSTTDSGSDSGMEVVATDTSAPVTGNIVAGIFHTIGNFFLGLNPTGNAIIEYQSEISGSASQGNEFVYDLQPGQTAELKPLSVSTNSGKLTDGSVHLETVGNQVIVTTDYSETSNGFGKNYLGADKKNIVVDLSKTGFVPETGNLKVSLVNANTEIISLNTVLQGEGTISANETIEAPEAVVDETPVDETVPVEKNVSQNAFPNESTPEVPLELTANEIISLYNKFGDAPVKIEEAKTRNGLLTVRYTLGDYWIENSYPEDLDNASLHRLMQEDVTKWQKDLAKRFTVSVENDEGNVSDIVGTNFSLIG